MTLVANIGIVMFLFVVGLEIDIAYVKKNWKIASTVGLISLAFPFCLGVAMSKGLYDRYVPAEDKGNISFGVYSLFIGVAVAITAFPVLARILTELGLLRDRVGVVVLAAGISNDIVGWILLALTITLANSAKAINTLYIILLTCAWFIVLVYLVKPVLAWYLRKSGSIENGPSEMAVSVCILLAFVSAFYTDVIGVHPIFGAFLAGAIIPRDNHFVVKLTEKIEDFITLILLPLYFSLAGLNVNIGSLNDGVSWGYVVCAIVVSMFGKIVGGMVPAKLHGLRWREAFTVGGLMSCKGIVEIVVLQLGFQAGILSVKVFTMFIIMALITTFITTPLTLKLYPIWYRIKVAKWRNGEIEWDGTPIVHRRDPTEDENDQKEFKLKKIAVILDSVESMPVIMMLTQLLAAPQSLPNTPAIPLSPNSTPDDSAQPVEHPDLSAVTSDITMQEAFLTQRAESQGLYVNGLRLVDLSERTADVMQVMNGELIDGDEDPVIQVFSTFTKINQIPFEGKLAVTPQLDRSSIIMSIAQQPQDLLIIAWNDSRELVNHPELLDNIQEIREGALPNSIKLSVCKDLFTTAKSQVGLFLDRGFVTRQLQPSNSAASRHVFVPFYGGNDDKVAVGIALYLAKNANFFVTIGNMSESSEAWDYVNHLYDILENIRVKNRIKLLVFDTPKKDIVETVLEVFDGEPTFKDLIIIGRSTDNTPNNNIPYSATPSSSSTQRQTSSDSRMIPSRAATASSGIDTISDNVELVGKMTRKLICAPPLHCSFFIASSPKVGTIEDFNEK